MTGASKGVTDLYQIKWTNKKSGKGGLSPFCWPKDKALDRIKSAIELAPKATYEIVLAEKDAIEHRPGMNYEAVRNKLRIRREEEDEA